MSDFNFAAAAKLYRSLADLFDAVLPPTPPTGRQMPILNDARVAVLKQMQIDNTVDWQRIKATADATTVQYDDNGRAAAIVYRVTGDATYAVKSYSLLMQPVSAYNDQNVLNANNVRQYLVEFPLIYAWIRDALTDAQKTAFEDAILHWSDFALGFNQTNVNLGGFRTGDSDQTIGQYFGLAVMDGLGIGPGNLVEQVGRGAIPTPVGGLNVTAEDQSTARNAIKQFCVKTAKGGTWFESAEYNSNTVVILLMGWMAMQDIHGQDYFPEVGEWAVDACDAVLLSYTPDLKGRIEWGDDERPGQMDWFEQMPYLAAMQHAAVRLGHLTQAGHVGDMLDKMLAASGNSSFEGRYYLFVDHNIPSIPYYDGVGPLTNYSPGVGLYSRFDGQSLFAAFSPTNTFCDHANCFVGDLTWYVGNEWVLHHPVTYGGIANYAVGQNSLLVSGLSAMDSRGPLDCQTMSDYSYFVGSSNGRYYGAWKTANPAPFCFELTRTVLYLPASGCIFLCDRFNSVEPASVLPDGNMWIYYQPEKDAINGEATKGPGHRHQVIWHTPVVPNVAIATANGVKLAWTTAGGQQMEITSYSPNGPMKTDSYDEQLFLASAIGQQVRVHFTTDDQFQTLISVVRLNPSADAPVAIIPAPGIAGLVVDGVTVLFGVDKAGRLMDPATTVVGAGKTYLVGCSGSNAVVAK